MNEPGDVPKHVDYRRFATRERTIEGDIPLSDLPRIVAEAWQAPAPDAVARLELGFYEDGQRRVYATGRIEARLVLQCQRCLTAFEQRLDVPVSGVVVADDAASAHVPRADEPIVADGDTLDVYALAEDELLLAMPNVARCGRPACRAQYDVTDDASDDTPRRRRQDNPFAVLGRIGRGEDDTH